MGTEPSPRERLVAMVALLDGDPIEAGWHRGEAYVAAMEAEPDKPRQCPCCTKLVVCCLKHYLLHEPGKKCVTCWGEE